MIDRIHRKRPTTDPRVMAEAVFKSRADSPPSAPVDQSLPQPRELVSLRIDRDVLDYFRAGGPGWQDRINLVLRKVASQDDMAPEAR